MHVIPKPGFVIRDPDLLDILQPEGREVPQTTYWIRRLADGDVLPAPASQDAAPESTTDRSTEQ